MRIFLTLLCLAYLAVSTVLVYAWEVSGHKDDIYGAMIIFAVFAIIIAPVTFRAVARKFPRKKK